MGNRNTVIIVGGAFIILVIGFFLLSKPAMQPQTMRSQPMVKPAVPNEMYVLLSAQNNSNESGIANLKETYGRVTVTLNLSGSTPNVIQPAHIHMGVCPGVGAVKYPLNSVLNGKSVTVLDVSLMQLKQQLPLAINVHKSAADITNYTSCGPLST